MTAVPLSVRVPGMLTVLATCPAKLPMPGSNSNDTWSDEPSSVPWIGLPSTMPPQTATRLQTATPEIESPEDLNVKVRSGDVQVPLMSNDAGAVGGGADDGSADSVQAPAAIRQAAAHTTARTVIEPVW